MCILRLLATDNSSLKFGQKNIKLSKILNIKSVHTAKLNLLIYLLQEILTYDTPEQRSSEAALPIIP